MGKRKSAKPMKGPRKKETLDTTFGCLFCNHENSVVVKLDKKMGLADLSCKVCGQKFQTGINYLSAGVDVYSDWVDACDKVAKDACEDEEDTAKHDGQRLPRGKPQANSAADTRDLGPANSDDD